MHAIRRNSNWKRSRGGFVLLMALLLISIAVLTLAGIARRSMSLALDSLQAQRELQQRWGAASIRRALLPRAPTIAAYHWHLAGERASADQAPLPLSATVRLGEVTFRLVLHDENTKANVNRMQTYGGRSATLQLLQRLTGVSHTVRLRPHRPGAVAYASSPFDSWGQVFALDRILVDDSTADWLARHTAAVTCWGNGRLNFVRTPSFVLEAVCLPILGATDTERLLAARRREPTVNLASALDRLAIRRSKRQRLIDWLTDESSCFTLWIESRVGQQVRHELAVAEPRSTGPPRVLRFRW